MGGSVGGSWVGVMGGNPMTINIEWQDQHGNWHHYQTQHNQPSEYRTAEQRALPLGSDTA